MRTLLFSALLTITAIPVAAEKQVIENNPDAMAQHHAPTNNPPQDFNVGDLFVAELKPCDGLLMPGRSDHAQRQSGTRLREKPGCDKPIGRFPQQTKPDRG